MQLTAATRGSGSLVNRVSFSVSGWSRSVLRREPRSARRIIRSVRSLCVREADIPARQQMVRATPRRRADVHLDPWARSAPTRPWRKPDLCHRRPRERYPPGQGGAWQRREHHWGKVRSASAEGGARRRKSTFTSRRFWSAKVCAC